MRFTFSEDQLMFRDSVRGMLEKECTAERVRAAWETEAGRVPGLWEKLAEIGLLGLLVPEEHGGLAMDEIDAVLLFEESGRVALPEPLVESAAVAVPLLRAIGGDLAAVWLPRIAAGQARVAVAHPSNATVPDAHDADLLLLAADGELHALPADAVALEAQPGNDPGRRLSCVDWRPSAATRLAGGDAARAHLADALDRAALATAAQLLGVGQQMVALAVVYAAQREQFGAPIGSFQAIKHMLASVQVQLEFARPLVHRAAHSLATAAPCRAADVSAAKATAGEAALQAAKTALQVHGAIGYTWECDLQIWMKRAWALELAWGSSAWHRARLGAALLDGAAPLRSFGYSTPA